MDAAWNSWKLVSLSPLPGWAVWALVLAVLGGVALAGWGVRREPRRWRLGLLWGLRVLAGVLLVLFLLEPGLRQMQVAQVKAKVAVLVDRSASMELPVDAQGTTRSAAVARALASLAPGMAALQDTAAFEVQGFEPELAPLSPEVLAQEPARGTRTDLTAALRALKASAGGGRKLAGVLLFSDGADNTELSTGLTARARALLRDLAVPVSTVAVGGSSLQDLAVDGVRADDFAFVRNSLTVEVDVHARGFAGQVVPLVLKREGTVVASRQVVVDSDDSSQTVSFTFTPDQTGRFVYTVSLPVLPGEAVAQNNSRAFTLKVIRDRVRVLLVASRPSWDERFLRGLLRQDANVELISFYILRNTTDITGAFDEKSELSLIPFPHEEIFRNKINTFDVMIILNFGNEDRNIALTAYARDIHDYVEGGGALAFVGGDRSFGESQALDSPFSPVLPVEAVGTAELGSFQPRLTVEGQRHPVTALATGSVTNEEAWGALPGIPGMNSTRLKPGATALMVHPSATAGGAGLPLLALWEFGRGRALALTSDATWYWAFPAHAAGAAPRSYERFWGNAIRWLVRDPELTQLSVTAEPGSVEPGRPVTVLVVARRGDYQPAPGAELLVELRSVETGETVDTLKGTAGPDGTARFDFPPPPPGAYKVVGRASLDGKPLGESSDAVAVRAVGPELSDARVNTALLRALADESGGRFFEGAVDAAQVPLSPPPLVEVGRAKDQPVWDRWYWLVAMVAVIGLEWALRRRFGYI